MSIAVANASPRIERSQDLELITLHKTINLPDGKDCAIIKHEQMGNTGLVSENATKTAFIAEGNCAKACPHEDQEMIAPPGNISQTMPR
jgi:hypothetical protein